MEKLQTKFADLLLKNRIGNKTIKWCRYRVYFLLIEDYNNRKIIYYFSKALKLTINAYCGRNYKSEQLVDFWIDENKSITVSYMEWHIIQSNMIRVKYSHSFEEFKLLIKQDDELNDLFERVSNKVLKKVS